MLKVSDTNDFTESSEKAMFNSYNSYSHNSLLYFSSTTGQFFSQ